MPLVGFPEQTGSAVKVNLFPAAYILKEKTSLHFVSPHRHRLLLARLMSPVSGADQVRVGPLQGHRSRVTAQNPNHSGGQLLNPRNYRTHSWTEYGAIN